MPPLEGWSKINFDGSFVEQIGEAGADLIAQDSQGELIFTTWRAIHRCANAVEAEAVACADGFQLAAQWIQGPVIFETNCERVHNSLTNLEDQSEISFIISTAKEHVQMLVGWRVIQVKRECNSIAHDLAHLARCYSDSAFWLRSAPACVTEQVTKDCNSIYA